MSDNLTDTVEAGSTAELDARRRRLKFRANHRGTFETDILIGGFVQDVADTLNAAELTDMEAILEMPDPDLTDWLFGRLPLPEEKATPMLRRMVDACRARCGH
ncbi:FAD assembly factor SdhE [Acetobacter papayae]|uniref:FAD assembly factor SdhE n=1 Tax=Acetobacter papayae TaxID=1076592 RepID=UPI00046F13D5|nr:succinate dehydrogenase assembly factor 2 [Acetobacter papayae]